MNGVTVDPQAARMARFTARLNRRLAVFRARTVIDDDFVRDVQAAVNRARSRAIEQGLKLPPLTVFVLPTSRHVEVYRADAEPQAIGMTLSFLARTYNASAEDLMWGLKRAYPMFTQDQLN